MTVGVGGSNFNVELEKLESIKDFSEPISKVEFQSRINKAQKLMQDQGMDAVYLHAGTNLYYFTGTRWHPSERLVGALLPADGDLIYMAPHFEVGTLKGFALIEAEVACWHEHENPYKLLGTLIQTRCPNSTGVIGMDESTPFFVANGLQQQFPQLRLTDAKSVISGCRMQKSKAEIALMQQVKDMTLEVQKSVARILHEGITTTEVEQFINKAHQKLGAQKGSYFCIVLFGADSAFPHGVKSPKKLEKNDMVLIDTGCQIEGYISDITRSYVFGTPSDRQKHFWNLEKQAQKKAFDAAQLGQPCSLVDQAARQFLAEQGLGPDYQLPGLPHRTGHGIGLDIHEWPYLVGSEQTPLTEGMCFSNEPMICVPGEFGVRLEDHFYMTDKGPRWFTQPSHSIENPFGQ